MKQKIIPLLFLILFYVGCGKSEKSPKKAKIELPKLKTYYILTKRSLVRKAPSLRAKVLSVVPKNSMITILKRKMGWILFVKSRKFHRGWVRNPQLLEFKSRDPYFLTKKTINFHLHPTRKSKTIFITGIKSGDENYAVSSHTIIRTGIIKNNWERVLTPYNQLAWANLEDLKRKSNSSKNSLYIKKLNLFVKYTSQLKEGRYIHSPKNLFDNDFSTAWQEADGVSTIGEWVEFTFPPLPETNLKIYIVNGIVKKSAKFKKYGRDGDLYYLNNRLKKVKITYSKTDFCTGMAYYQRFLTKTVVLKDNVKKPQYLFKLVAGLHPPIIRLEILSVYKGEKWDDTPIGEIIIKRKKVNKTGKNRLDL